MKKFKNCRYIFFLFYLMSVTIYSNHFIHIDSLALAKTKASIRSGTASSNTFAAYKKLLDDAATLLTAKNPTVIDKKITPPSGNKQDYLSISRYWWPDPTTKDGLPWIRKDGITNPDTQTDAVDRQRLAFMGRAVKKLSLAYYFTQDERYAKKAISILNTWFIHPETRMYPHLEFAQSVPGNPNKRATGILDGRSIILSVPDAITLVSGSKYWSIEQQTIINKWLSDYLKWLTESELGKKGSLQKNNHGSWYTYQVAALAFYLNDKPLVKKMVEKAQTSLDNALNDVGGQIHELSRSKSFFYSCYNLQALCYIADLGNKVGMHMWQYETENKKSLFLAIHYLTPVVQGEKWPHDTLKGVDLTNLIPILYKAEKHYKTKEYKKLLLKIIQDTDPKKLNQRLPEFWLLHAFN